MGIKKFFKIKPPEEDTPDQNREILNELGISTKNPAKKRRERFAAYGKFARDKAQDKVYAPEGYENYTKQQDEDDLNKSELDNEAGNTGGEGAQRAADPYSTTAGGSDPYAINPTAYGSDPYSNMTTNNYQATSNPDYISNSAEPSLADPYQAPSGYNSSYDGFGSAGGGHASYGAVNNGAVNNGLTSQGRPHASPYGEMNSRDNSYPSKSSVDNPKVSSNPYGAMSYGQSDNSRSEPPLKSGKQTGNPYASLNADSYSSQSSHTDGNPYPVNPARSRARAGGPANRSDGNPYPGNSVGNAVRAGGPANRRLRPPGANDNMLKPVKSAADTLDLNKSNLDGEDLNEEPRAGEFDFEEKSAGYEKNTVGVDELDFNATLNAQDAPNDLNSNVAEQQQQLYEEAPQWQLEEEAPSQSEYAQNYDRGYKSFDELQKEEEARQQQEEDEAVDEIKQEIRFTKQSSVASTRNTLKMAQEAEMSGMNSIGLLGHQSERLNDIEGNLDLMKVQNKIADDKVAELKKLNRNILAIHVSNPFNSKRRQRDREENIKNRKIEEKLMKEHTSQELSRSTQRVESALNGNNDINTVREKYQRQQIMDRSKRFQFENDEEDDMMEVEIDRNLDQIQQISGRLKKLAVATGEELDSQQTRVRNIEDNTDDLDIKIHLNTTRLSGIR